MRTVSFNASPWLVVHSVLRSLQSSSHLISRRKEAQYFERIGVQKTQRIRCFLRACSTLVSIVDADGSPVVQFSHFSVKEYLTSSRMLEGRVPRYHIPLEPAHVVVTEACVSVLLHLDNDITRERLKEFPLVMYAAEYWVSHAKFGDVLSHAEDMIKRLFNPGNPHFSAWVWTYNLDGKRLGQYESMVTATPP